MTVRPVSTLLAALALATALAVAPAGARPTAGDAAATRAYLHADYVFVRDSRARIAPGEAGLTALVHQIAGACPLAAASSPQDHNAEQLSNEVAGALTAVAYRADASAIATFARAVGGLRWHNRVLTHTVRTYAAKLEGLATLAIPDVCGDVKAWAASGYRTLPASTAQFDQRYYATDVEAEEVPARLLALYENARDASLARRTKQLEAPLAEAEAHAVKDYTRILNALELQE